MKIKKFLFWKYKYEIYGREDCSETGFVPFTWVNWWTKLKVLLGFSYTAKCPFCKEIITGWI